ncbi:Pkinase-domain-containing protein [Peniophora sp. CONT]|nr:Pkinase-domain-containing protein [Peniophora sp. CONT]
MSGTRNGRSSPKNNDQRRGRQDKATSDSSESSVASPSSWIMTRGRSRVRRMTDESNPFSEENLRKRGYHTFRCLDQTFRVEKRWQLIREMGSGAYGVVASAADEISGETVAIKMVTRVFDKVSLAKRALRELTLLRHFNNHENITGLIDVDAIAPGFNEIYLFMEPMEADLHQIIKSGQALTNEHTQYFVYQILRGMKYIHSASVVHRDLKPGNLLVNSDCELKICDFGLSRGFDAQSEDGVSHMTEYVATRWYRAPEIMLAFRRYDTAIDVWSIGCILAELLLGKPMFKGKDYVDQLNKILDFVGTPSDEVLKRIASDKARAYVRTLPIRKKQPLNKVIPNADPQALDLLEKLLAFDPAARLTVEQAIAHPWLSAYHDVNDEPTCPQNFDRWREIEELETLDDFRAALWAEIEDYRREVRSIALEEDEHPGPLRSPSYMGSASHSPTYTRVSPSQPAPSQLPPTPEAHASYLTAQPSTSSSVTPHGSNIVSFPTTAEHSPEKPAQDEMLPPAIQRLRHGRYASVADPLMSYSRRTSIFSVPDNLRYHPQATGTPPSGLPRESNEAAYPFPTVNGGSGYVLPARSRTASVIDMPRRLLRTLSTVSIYEPIDVAALAAAGSTGQEVADMARAIRAKETDADGPASAIPGEIASSNSGSSDKSAKEGGSHIRNPAETGGEEQGAG